MVSNAENVSFDDVIMSCAAALIKHAKYIIRIVATKQRNSVSKPWWLFLKLFYLQITSRSNNDCGYKLRYPILINYSLCFVNLHVGMKAVEFIVRRAGLLWSQQDFEWRRSVPLFKCLTVLEFSFILFDLCLLITFFIFIMNYVPIVTFWIFTYHKIWILSIMFCSIWSYWIIYFLACLEVSWRVVS